MSRESVEISKNLTTMLKNLEGFIIQQARRILEKENGWSRTKRNYVSFSSSYFHSSNRIGFDFSITIQLDFSMQKSEGEIPQSEFKWSLNSIWDRTTRLNFWHRIQPCFGTLLNVVSRVRWNFLVLDDWFRNLRNLEIASDFNWIWIACRFIKLHQIPSGAWINILAAVWMPVDCGSHFCSFSPVVVIDAAASSTPFFVVYASCARPSKTRKPSASILGSFPPFLATNKKADYYFWFDVFLVYHHCFIIWYLFVLFSISYSFFCCHALRLL